MLPVQFSEICQKSKNAAKILRRCQRKDEKSPKIGEDDVEIAFALMGSVNHSDTV